MVKKASRQPEVQEPFDARVATLSFPLDDDLPDRKVVVYFCPTSRH
jgi:hypothetical protein